MYICLNRGKKTAKYKMIWHFKHAKWYKHDISKSLSRQNQVKKLN